MMDLPKPKVLRCFFERSFDLPLPAMELCWDTNASADRSWHLPDCVLLQGPPPDRFGVTIHRCGEDAYQVRLLWNRLALSWEGLTRVQILASSLAPILSVLGTELWYLLNQPVEIPSLAQAA